MRLVALYLRCRRSGYVAVGLLIVALAGAISANWLVSVPQLGGAGGHALIPVVLIAPLLSACVIGLGVDSPSRELELTASVPLHRLRAAQLFVLGSIAVASLVHVAWTWDEPDAASMLLRNLAGFAGLTFLSAWLFGGRLSWGIPLTFAMLSVLTGRDATGKIATWAWTVLPGDDSGASLIVTGLLITGATLLIWRGPGSVSITGKVSRSGS